MDFSNPDVFLPAAIIGFCLLLMAVVAAITRQQPTRQITVPQAAPRPQDGPPPAQQPPAAAAVGRNDLAEWHHRYGGSVRSWIQNHEDVLRRVSEDGLELDTSNEALLAGHARLAPLMRNAITDHPAPAMQAQLSAMIVASEATLHALRRAEYQSAERQHLTYLEYRNLWLQRLRQFTSGDTEIRQIRQIGTTPGH